MVGLPPQPCGFSVGSAVAIHGLVNKTELNGKKGIVERIEGARYVVSIDGSGEYKSLAGCNLVRSPPGLTASTSENPTVAPSVKAPPLLESRNPSVKAPPPGVKSSKSGGKARPLVKSPPASVSRSGPEIKATVDPLASRRVRLKPLEGKILFIVPEKKFGFIAPNKEPIGEKIFFHFDKVRQSGGLLLKRGDAVSYILDKRKTNHDGPKKSHESCEKAKLVKVCVLHSKSRQRDELMAHVEEQYACLVEGNRFEHGVGKVLKMCGGDQIPFWHLCGVFARDEDLSRLFRFAVELVRIGGGDPHALHGVVKSPIYDPETASGQLLVARLAQRSFPEHDAFARCVARRAPSYLHHLVPVLGAVIEKNPRPIGMGSDLLMLLFSTAALGLSRGDIALNDWRTLPMVPTSSELLGQESSLPTVLQRTLLPVVVEKGPYRNVSDYLNTYIRLLREDCFDALKTGVNKFIQGDLDQRDMRTYHARLVGIHVIDRLGIGLDLQIIPHKAISNFQHTEALMFGNLLCMSIDARFANPCWATILDRNVERLQATNIVTVELVSVDNSANDLMHAVKMLMEVERFLVCESPTYYRAYQPVLESLQNMDDQDIPFQRELVHGATEGTVPAYLEKTSSLDASVIFDKEPMFNLSTLDFSLSESDFSSSESEHTLESLLQQLSAPCAQERTSLDTFQLEALKHVLTHRVSIIQGGPGCGKSTLGIRLLRLLLTASSEARALVVTYKNHALDGLLEGCLPYFRTNIARIGGRSNELLNNRSLNVLRRHRASLAELQDIRELDHNMKDMIPEMESAVKCFAAASEFTPGCFWRRAPESLTSLLSGKWSGTKKAQDALEYIRRSATDISERFAVGATKFDNELRGLLDSALKEWLPPKFRLDASLQRSNIPVSPDDDEVHTDDIEHKEFERLAGRTTSKKKGDLSKMIELTRREDTIKASPSMIADVDMHQEMYLRGQDVWDMSLVERAIFVQLLMRDELMEVEEEFGRTLTEWEEMAAERQRLNNLVDVAVLKEQKIVGATSTGVCLNQNLMKLLRPTIVCIEEAAELLEPQVLACLGPWVEHLILIGDHWQLPPSVNSFTLKKDHHFGLSMMERLIQNDLSYGKLMKQSRMRPETSALLRPRYPELQDNLPVVTKLPSVPSLTTNVFWWSHDFLEQSGRSPSNPYEAERVIRLALYLVLQGEHPSKITIMAPYIGQVSVLRRERDKVFPKQLDLLGLTAKEGESKLAIEVIPLDRFQGSENEIIIVSMVRNNPEYRKGFLETDEGLNRRVVLQSRNRRALYIVGSRRTFQFCKSRSGTVKTSKVYGSFIEDLEAQNFIGDALILRCPRHPDATLKAQGAGDIPDSLQRTVCNRPCGERMECNAHTCQLRCHHLWKDGHASHGADNCVQEVPFTCTDGHPLKRRCNEASGSVKCRARVDFMCSNGHSLTRECHEDAATILCRALKSHKCPAKHIYDVMCGVHTADADKLCEAACARMLSCGHTCARRCGKTCSSLKCHVEINYTCQWGHPNKRRCSDDVEKLKCKALVQFTCSKADHPLHRVCHVDVENSKCDSPCTQTLPCGHMCQKRCYEPCAQLPSQCEECQKIIQVNEKKAQEALKQQQEEARRSAQQELEALERKQSVKTSLGVDKSDRRFLDIASVVTRLSSGDRLRVKVEKIDEMIDTNVQKCQLRAKSRMVDPAAPIERILFWCRGQSKTSILQAGFKLMKNLFGVCVEFYANQESTHGYLFVCDVLIGRKWIVKRDHPDVANLVYETKDSIRKRGYDSLFALGDGTTRDLTAIYDNHCIYPRYLVRYTLLEQGIVTVPTHWTHATEGAWSLVLVKDRAEFEALRKCIVPEDAKQLGVGRDVQSAGAYSSLVLTSAWRLEHPGLWAKYAAELLNMRTIDFQALRAKNVKIPTVKLRKRFYNAYKDLPQTLAGEVNEVMLLHGTKPETVMKILSSGMNERYCGGIFGNGVYLAEDGAKNDQYVTVDRGYDKHSELHAVLFDQTKSKHPGSIFYLFLCRVLLGVPQVTKSSCSTMRECDLIDKTLPGYLHHCLLAETGGNIARFREFIQFHGSRVYPEYLLSYQRK